MIRQHRLQELELQLAARAQLLRRAAAVLERMGTGYRPPPSLVFKTADAIRRHLADTTK